MIIIRNIRKALNGDDFKAQPASGGKPVIFKGVELDDQCHYFTLYSRYKEFGMYNGKAYPDELPWLIDFYSFMNKTYNLIESWKINGGGNRASINPGEAGL